MALPAKAPTNVVYLKPSLQEKLDSKVRELQRAQDSLRQFAYAASHDLREPLRAITSFVTMLEEELRETLTADQRQYVEFAMTGAGQMNRLIDDLLVYSRVNQAPLVRAEVSLDAVVGSCLDDLGDSLEGAILEFSPLPIVRADPAQMRQILDNLISNALKFRRGESVYAQIRALDEDHAWKIEVEDDGMGIEARFTDRVFEIFQRLHSRERFEGTGLGLAVCRQIVERHGGEIGLESEVGEGTCVWFTLPKQPGDR